MELVAGSRSEGLGMDSGWGQEPADTDIMYLYGGGWGVRIGDTESDHSCATGQENSSLIMTQADVPPCYCRVTLTGDIEKVSERMGLTVHRTNPIRKQCTTIILDMYGIMLLYAHLPFPWIILGGILLLLFHHSKPFEECQSWLLYIYCLYQLNWLVSLWGAFCTIPLIWFTLSRYFDFKQVSFIGPCLDYIFSHPIKIFHSIREEVAVNCFVKMTNCGSVFLSSPWAFQRIMWYHIAPRA